MAVVLSIPCFVLSLLSFKDSSLDANEFQKRNKKHIFLLISFGLAYLANSYELGSTVVPTLSIFSLAAGVLIIFGFFKVLQQIRFNKYYLKVLQAKKAQEEAKEQQRYTFEQTRFETNNQGNQIGEENLAQPEIKEEVKEQPSELEKVKLDELYSLLSKLEKSYKNGEVNQEDYERMKKTLLENYMK